MVKNLLDMEEMAGHGFDPWSGKILHTMKQLSLCATAIDPVL